MKMRTVFSLLIVLFFVSTFYTAPSFAQEPQLIRLHYPAEVIGFAYSPDGTTVAVRYEDGKVRLWDAETGEMRHTLEHPNVNAVSDIAYSPDGATLATADDDWKVRLWDVATGTIRRTLIGHTDAVVVVAYSPDGTMIASSGRSSSRNNGLRSWDATTGTLIRLFTNSRVSYSSIRNIAYSPDGTTIAAIADFRVWLWDATTGRLLHKWDGSGSTFAYSPDGTTIAAGGSRTDGVSLWDVATGTLLHRLRGHTDFVTSVAYSPDSRTVASGSADSSVRLWDVATGTLTNILASPTHVHDVAYSPDGRTLASTSVWNGGELRLWDATTGTHLRTLGGSSPGATIHMDKDSVVYSPDGTTIAHWPSVWGSIDLWKLTPPPPPILFTPSEVADQTFTLGTPVSLTLPFATGGTAPYIYTLAPLPNGLQFDPATRELYGTPFTPMDATPVTYTATDTTGASASLTFTITVEDTPALTDGHIYWTDPVARRIQRANLDGTNVQNVIKELDWPEGLALDLSAGKIYWTGWDGPEWRRNGNNKIQRANLNGTNIETLVTGDEFTKSNITLDLTAGKMYWVHWTGEGPGGQRGGNTLQRANLDGSNVETLVRDLYNPRYIALDISQGKMYWTDAGIDAGIDAGGTGKIQRANMDGTDIETVLAGLHTPIDIALDFSGGQMYWTDWYTGKVQCANFDGSNLTDLVLGLDHPVGIALDNSGGKVYWAEYNGSRIRRANLDGSHVEDLVTTGLQGPLDITLGIPQTPGDLRLRPNVVADRTFTVGTAVSLTLPVATGGTPPYAYSLTPSLPAGLYFDSIANRPGYIGGTPTAALPPTPFTYTATDTTGAFVSLSFTITVEAGGLNLDVNGDGQVDVLDLVLVAALYGTRLAGLAADVNADGVVNIQDLIAVAAGIDAAEALPLEALEQLLLIAAKQAADFEAAAGAPVIGFSSSSEGGSDLTTYRNVAAALSDVRVLATSDAGLGKWVPMLEGLLQVLTEMRAIPETTAVLPNYPNPFNPETWIPYHLAQAAEVTLTIYDVHGRVVRELVLGHQPAGVYQSRGRAAYWDGRNQHGEKVASGVYFYTLTAGDFNATRKLLIAK